ncbi:hypothetical protein, partial [Desulfosporosinus sp. OT]|uniref:hypothetical protein n=1 Tax=Desulfosporosinus sp. OT TaxID=913865 RepID=UPI000223AA39
MLVYLAIRKADEPFATRRPATKTPAVWILRSQGLAPQVSSALKRKAGEPFATLRPKKHTPAVWILNFRVRYTKSTIVSSGDYRRATHPKETLRGEGSFSPHCVP